MNWQAILIGLSMLVGAVAWLVRLEGRINVADARYEDVKADLEEIKADLKRLLLRRHDD